MSLNAQHERTIYFIRQPGVSGPVKIGCTVDVAARLRAMRAGSPVSLDLVASLTGTMEIEWRFHALFRDSHSHHEWFHPSPLLEAVIAGINAEEFDVTALPEPRRLPRGKGSPIPSDHGSYDARMARA